MKPYIPITQRTIITNILHKKLIKSMHKEEKRIFKGKRGKRLRKEFKQYGFTSADTWNLENTILMMTYERLCLYRDKATKIVDLTQPMIEHNNETISVENAIDRMINLAARAISNDNIYYTVDEKDPEEFDAYNESEKEAIKATQEFWELWAKCHPYMWW